MKVTICANVDIEEEVDVDFEAFSNEIGERFSNPDNIRELIAGLDYLTRILDRIPEETVAKFKPVVREELHRRLKRQTQRFASEAS